MRENAGFKTIHSENVKTGEVLHRSDFIKFQESVESKL